MRIKTDSFVLGLGPGRGRAQVWEPCHTSVPEFLLDSCDFVHPTCPHSAPQFCSPQISLLGWEQKTWLYMLTLFLILVKRNKKERHENDHLQLSYSQSSFPKLLVTKPELVAHHPGRERRAGKKREWKRGKRREKLGTRRE